MAVTTKPVVNFSGGEASPLLKGRVDVLPYFTCSDTLLNVIGSHYGSAYKTPGTFFLARTKFQDKGERLIPFIFSSGDSYMLEFGDEYIRFFQDGGSVVGSDIVINHVTKDSLGTVTTAAPHGLVDGDFIDITGIVGMVELNERRFIVQAATTSTFRLKDEDGVSVVTSSYIDYISGGVANKVYEIVSPWDSADVDKLKFTQQADVMYIVHPEYAPRKLSRLGSTSWTLSEIAYNTFDYPPFLPINTTATTLACNATTGTGKTLTASASLFTSSHVGAYFQLTDGSTTGYVKITAVASGTSATCDVIVTLGGTSATDDWYEGAWSIKQGYPSDVKFYENRLYYFSTLLKPLTVWGSVIEEYDNFKYGSNDDDAVSYSVSSAQVDRILWAYPSDILNLGTAGGMFNFQSGSSVDPVSATNVSVKQQNEDGASDISPMRIGPNVYYVSRSGEILYQITYDWSTNSYPTKNITYLNDHVLSSGVVDMALQQYPYSIAWCVLGNGQIATMTREVENNVKCWTRQIFAGTGTEVQHVCSTPSSGTEDTVWFAVKRTIDSNTRRYIEVLTDHNFTTPYLVQSGLTYIGASTTTLTNLDHLEGQVVQVVTNGAVHPDCTVTDGSITLDWAATDVVVGLGYKAVIKTLDLEAGGNAGTAQGQIGSLFKVMVRFYKSLGCTVGNGKTQDIIPFRSAGDKMNVAPDLFTGDKFIQFPSGHSTNKFIQIEQAQPLPLHVLGIFPLMAVNG